MAHVPMPSTADLASARVVMWVNNTHALYRRVLAIYRLAGKKGRQPVLCQLVSVAADAAKQVADEDSKQGVTDYRITKRVVRMAALQLREAYRDWDYCPEPAPTKYLDPSLVTGQRTTEVPRSGQTRVGYGGRLPTCHMLLIGKRWHRVCVMQWSNAGTAYVVSGGKLLLLGNLDLSGVPHV